MSNILIDIRSLLDKPYTGVAQYTLNYLNSLFAKDAALSAVNSQAQLDKDNQYFLFYNSARFNDDDLPKFDFPNVKMVDFHWPNKLFNFCLKFFKWPKIDKLVERKIGKKIDEMFLPNFNFIALSENIKKTLVVHDLSFEFFPYFFTFKQRLWHHLINPKKICQQATKIITHSQNTKDDLIRVYGVAPEKIEVQFPPINSDIKQLDKSDPQLLKIKEKYNLPNDFILYLGNLEPRKNLDTLIRAFAQLLYSKFYILNSDLIIAGSGREMSKLKKLTKDLGITDKVNFVGYIPEQDKNALYNLCKFFVYPSFYEGFGYPVYEALSCGKKVITSHTSSLAEISNPNIIFINPNDLNDLSEAIKGFIQIFNPPVGGVENLDIKPLPRLNFARRKFN